MEYWKEPLIYHGLPQSGFELLAEKLKGLGYGPATIAETLGLSSVDELYPLDYRLLPRWDKALAESRVALAPALRLLMLGLPVEKNSLIELLGAEAAGFLMATGLAFESGGRVHPRITIVPFENLLVATDRLFRNADPESAEEGLSSDNCVWRLDRTTLLMSKAMKRGQARNALELGCGSGVLALLAAKEAKRVTAVDINPRAVNVALFNARLNGMENVEFLQGDLYHPVKGKTFDYIFSNPPSAPGLVRAWNREGGTSGRVMVEEMLRGLKEHLEPRGIFQTTMHFGYRHKGDIEPWARKLIDPERFDILYDLMDGEEEAEAYALREAYQKAGARDYGSFSRTYRLYRENLGRSAIDRISFGLLTIERRPPLRSCAKEDMVIDREGTTAGMEEWL